MNTHAQRHRRVAIDRARAADAAAADVVAIADLMSGHAQMILEDARRMRAAAAKNRRASLLLGGAATGASSPTLDERMAS